MADPCPPRTFPLPARGVAGVLMAALVLVGATSCRRPSPPAAAAPATTLAASPPGTYVAIGASDSVGVGASEPSREAWPVVLLHRALPPGTPFVNLALPGATVAEAIDDQVPRALALRPALVTVWLNVNDLRAGVTPSRFAADFDTLVRRLRDGDRPRVLVANVPPLDGLPALAGRSAGLGPTVDAYNRAIDEVAARHGATVVDLHSVGMEARAAGQESSLLSPDGFHPNTAGYALVAGAFADAVLGRP